MTVRSMLLAAAATMAAGTAQAQTVDFGGVGFGAVTDGTTVVSVTGGSGTGYLEQDGVGGAISARTIISPSTVFFRSGAVVSGPGSIATTTTGVNIVLNNYSGNEFYLSDFSSTIIPAGFGFFLQDRLPGADNIYLDNPKTTSGLTFQDLQPLVAPNVAFAGANFDFEITSQEDDALLYSVFGEISMRFNADGQLVSTYNVTDADAKLSTFEQVRNDPDAVGFRWGAQDIVVPLSNLPLFNPYDTKTIKYRAAVNAFVRAPCLNSGLTCMTAYTAFGDPIGRGGADEEFRVSGPDVSGLDGPFNGLKFAELEFGRNRLYRPLDDPGMVPEPSTWALMIGGFGLAGAALRRRRRTITA